MGIFEELLERDRSRRLTGLLKRQSGRLATEVLRAESEALGVRTRPRTTAELRADSARVLRAAGVTLKPRKGARRGR